MKTIHWLFLVGLAMFVSSIGFVIAGARAARVAPAATVAPPLTAVASLRQIMQGIIDPASQVIFDAVGTTVTATGIEETKPRTPDEWARVGNSAAALAEAANLMMFGSRVIDQEAWVTMTTAMREKSEQALRAVEKQDADALFTAGGEIYTTCDNCHQRYKRY